MTLSLRHVSAVIPMSWILSTNTHLKLMNHLVTVPTVTFPWSARVFLVWIVGYQIPSMKAFFEAFSDAVGSATRMKANLSTRFKIQKAFAWKPCLRCDSPLPWSMFDGCNDVSQWSPWIKNKQSWNCVLRPPLNGKSAMIHFGNLPCWSVWPVGWTVSIAVPTAWLNNP